MNIQYLASRTGIGLSLLLATLGLLAAQPALA